jgi:adenosylmethionine-8-amino-7-oxononanoate aminotransferase
MVDELAALTGFNLSHTYNANPIACAAGSAVIDEIIDADLIGRAASVGRHLAGRLAELMADSPVVGDVRGEGLLLAIEYVTDKATKALFPEEIHVSEYIRRIGLRNGLMLYSRRQNRGRFGEWSVIAPPLTITLDQIDELVERLKATLDEFVDEMVHTGVV